MNRFEEELDKAAKNHMKRWSLSNFKHSHPRLFRTIMEAMGNLVKKKEEKPAESYLVDIEFRYNDKKPEKDDYDYVSKTVTIGVFDTLEEANEEGNKMIETLEKHFELHKFHQGHYAARERFSKNGGCFGSRNDLITNLAFLKTPFDFYAHVKKLKHLDLEEMITEAVAGCKRYREFKIRQQDEG